MNTITITVGKLCTLLEAELLSESKDGRERVVKSVLICDLMSHALARGEKDCAWVTVQNNMNVLAIAKSCEMACVILPEGIVLAERERERAEQEGINVLVTRLTGYEVCVRAGALPLHPAKGGSIPL